MGDVEIRGAVGAGFEPVREAFVTNFEREGEVGASVCVIYEGETVVDLAGGVEDPDRGTPFTPDTLATVFSTTKGVTAICANLLIERGDLRVDERVANYWPEFAAEGKGDVPVRDVLSHRAGVPAIDAPLTLAECLETTPVVRAIAAQRPEWKPGTKHGYHVRSYGWIMGELVRRVTGQSLGTFLREQITAPRDIDFWVGLPEVQEHRVAKLVPPPEPTDPKEIAFREKIFGSDTLLGRAMHGPSDLFHYDQMWNTRALHAAEMPSSNGIGSARGLARLYASTIGLLGDPLLAPTTIAAACEVRSEGRDAVILVPTRFGLGFMLAPTLSSAAGPRAFGHPGAGGSLAMADPEARMSFAYVMTSMRAGLADDPRARRLLEATYQALGRPLE